ncbi:serine hydrolase domain-containing protein [Stenotrophomonas acidaminiphila]
MRATPHRLFLFLFLAALALPAAFPAGAGPLENANAATRDFIRTTMKDRGIPGLQIAVIQGDRLLLSESHGLANVENRQPVERTTLFPINSATKAFTGVAVMQLVQAGRVDLEAPIATYLPDLPQGWRAVRVRQLLAHTSGLPDIVDAQGLVGGGSEQDAWRAVARMPVEAEPGERFAYNQTNYGLLARIVERQAGMSYGNFVAGRQFAPLGMRRSGFGDSYDLVPGAVTVYSYFPRRTDAPDAPTRLSHWFHDVPQGLWAGGGIQTTADELAQWLIALLQGRLIDAGLRERMWTPERLNDGSQGDWAAGWPVAGDTRHREVSSMGGARAAFGVYPDEGLAIVVLTNLVGANPQTFIPTIAGIYRAVPLAERR